VEPPPQSWRGVHITQLSYSDIGPNLVFEDGQLYFSDEFHIWTFLFKICLGKGPATSIYVGLNPFMAMLVCWHFSRIVLDAAIIFVSVFTATALCAVIAFYCLYRRAEARKAARKCQAAGWAVQAGPQAAKGQGQALAGVGGILPG